MEYKDLEILFEDNHLLVVKKPANIPCQADASGDKDMLTLLKEYLVDKYNKPGEAFLGLVHRLDRPTGGVMVFAKTSKAAQRLCKQFKDGEVEKKYLAVVEGQTRYKADKLINYLKKFGESNTVSIVPQLTEGAKYAELDYKWLEGINNEHMNLSLVQVNLVTGRSHQIRAQLSNIGHPLVGDKKYGSQMPNNGHLALWATELSFKHPVGGQQLVFRVYPPEIAPWTLFNIEQYLSVTIKNQ